MAKQGFKNKTNIQIIPPQKHGDIGQTPCFPIFSRIEQDHYGKIINLGSLHSSVGFADSPITACCASKGAVWMLTKALANEWAKYNITVNAIGPAYFPSEMTADVVSDPAFLGAVKLYCHMGRVGREG